MDGWLMATASLPLLSDQETRVDLLNNEAIASTIAKLIRERPEKPVTVGVHGDWGAGKSSVLEMIEAELDQDGAILCLKFNGWRFQGLEDAKIALLEGIVTGLLEKRPALTKASEHVKKIFRRINWLKVAKQVGGLAFTAYTGMPTSDQIRGVLNMLSDPAKLGDKENLDSVMNSVKSLLIPANESKNIPEEVNEFRKAFNDLLKEAKIEQLVVLIDDLDRCLPDIAIETLEAVRLFVFTSRTAFVVAADEAMIEYAVRKHFPDLPDTTGPQTYARNYLEKLIQIPFRIPALGEVETRIYITLLLVGAKLSEYDEGFKQLINVARERLKRPWTGKVLDSETVKKALNDKKKHVQDALRLSDQIGPILASGTKGNPRQIKRFLNMLALRQRTADARGFGEDVKLPVLAKLTLAEHFLPRFFEQVAVAAARAPDGICADLAYLETASAENKAPIAGRKKPKKKKRKTADDKKTSMPPKTELTSNPQLNEWLSSSSIRSWATVQPPLAEVDLRPYLFVAKDRKDYFGPPSLLGHLALVVEQLLGPKISVQGMETELKLLAQPEAMQVFDTLRGRIIGSDAFDKEPVGVAGLAVLVKAQPSLQSALLDFLESLPHGQLGPWVVSGWKGVINESSAVSRFERLLQTWKTSKGTSDFLKAAAEVALNKHKGGH